MTETRSRRPMFLPVGLAWLAAVAVAVAEPPAQTPKHFVTTKAAARGAIDDLPVLLQALPETALGRFVNEPDVASAIAHGLRRFRSMIAEEAAIAAAFRATGQPGMPVRMLLGAAIGAVGWQDVHSVELADVLIPDDEWQRSLGVLLVAPVAAARPRVDELWQRLQEDLAAHPDLKPADDQKVGGLPALVRNGSIEGNHEHGARGGIWLLRSEAQFAGGFGDWRWAGEVRGEPNAPPGVRFEFDVARVVQVAIFGSHVAAAEPPSPLGSLSALLGLDAAGTLRWHLGFQGEQVLDTLSLDLRATPTGILGALVQGMAPLPDQALPQGGLLQIRCALDVPMVLSTIETLADLAGDRGPGDLGLAEAVRKALTGGVAFAVCRPARGALVPRLYASLGIADPTAAGELLQRLRELEPEHWKSVTVADTPCWQYRPHGAPAAFQPTYALVGDTLHVAESGPSLRALLQAQDGPKHLDVGAATPPAGPGRVVGNFELRYDAAAIHAAMTTLWVPLLRTQLLTTPTDGGPTSVVLVEPDELPDPETFAPHLGQGIGRLRQDERGLALRLQGPLGGVLPALLLAAWPSALSAGSTLSHHSRAGHYRGLLAFEQMRLVHKALTSFQTRTGKEAQSFGDLVAAGDLAPALLELPGAGPTEPVLHDGKEVARTSYRFYPDGLPVDVQGNRLRVRMVSLQRAGWQRVVLDVQGNPHQSWDEFASIDELERAAKEGSK